ncbi:MAG: PIN domain-containing protein [Deltaproteobacteria bacterium]|nr:PIN domain-containing protein [Deltaproteobacteria bacterium]
MSPATALETNVYLLDTSALLTFIEDEEGSDRVETVLRLVGTLLPWPVLMETYYISLREAGRAEADRRYALIRQLPAAILWDMNEQILLTAARLKAEHHVSLADAIVAAYAIQNQAILIHQDPEFEALAGLLPMEALPYKAK